ncbi:AAA family ATPase, partial [Neoaquamicrobium sediminum]|uniref:AAA family ATPase n=1 Tax=Neoaquamicrobium sediminum TaxID=1849104 RepID=UPI004036FDE6
GSFTGPREHGLPDALLKPIFNHAIGKCGKATHKAESTMMFGNEADARLHVHRHGGVLSFINGEDELAACLVTRTKRVPLEDGFIPLRMMVLSMARVRLLEVFLSLPVVPERGRLSRADLIALHTDALYLELPLGVNSADHAAVRELLPEALRDTLTGAFGGARLADSVITLPRFDPYADLAATEVDDSSTAALILPTTAPAVLELPDERDTGACIAALDALGDRKVLAMGAAGTGKSHLMLTYAVRRHGAAQVVAVTPYNAQARKIGAVHGVRSVTYHEFEGETVGDTGVTTKRPMDLTGVTCVVLDEVMLFNHAHLVRVWKRVWDAPGVQVLATGDPRQLESIGDYMTNAQKKDLVRAMFDVAVELKVNKRLASDADRARLSAFENDLFSQPSTPAWVTGCVRRHFAESRILTFDRYAGGADRIDRGITFFNNSAFTLNKVIHKRVTEGNTEKNRATLSNGITYFRHQDVVCREGGDGVFTNCVYRVLALSMKEFTLKEKGGARDVVKVSAGAIVKRFALPYANTCHSAQGASIDVPFVITDWQFAAHADAAWLYTAVTRCTTMDHVWFLECDLTPINNWNQAIAMVGGYKYQDGLAKRAWTPEDYVTPTWIVTEYSRCTRCPGCRMHMTFEKHAPNKVSVDRRDNAVAHTWRNCSLMCVHCNTRKGASGKSRK